MVDWSLARQIARFASRGGDAGAPLPDLELERRVGSAQEHVIGYTRLEPAQPVPPPEAVGRDEWAGVNLDTLAAMLTPVTDRLDGRLGSAGPLAGALRVAPGAAFAAQAGGRRRLNLPKGPRPVAAFPLPRRPPGPPPFLSPH